jgi:voltage-dependent potassium channel beta subunit
MDYRNLGRSGLKVSTLSFGSWVTFGTQLDEDGAAQCMQTAFDAGVNFFDNAEAYAGGQSETLMGKVIAKRGWKRSDLVVSTKIFWGGSGPNDSGVSRKHLIEGTNASLKRLQLDYVDLLFCHRPDLHTPIEETVRAMDTLVRSGRVLYWGTSEWSATQLLMAYHVAKMEGLTPPTMEQPQYHMFHRERVEREYAPLYDFMGLGTTIWSPLASGLLTGKYNDGVPPDSRLALGSYGWLQKRILGDEGKAKIAKVRELTGIAKELGCTMAQLAIAWCAKNPRVSTVITGASRPAQVVENMKALEVVPKIDTAILRRIEVILQNAPEPEKDWRAA